MPEKPRIDPTDRSMLRVTMTIISPTATTTISGIYNMMLLRLSYFKNLGSMAATTKKTTMAVIMMPSSRNWNIRLKLGVFFTDAVVTVADFIDKLLIRINLKNLPQRH